MNILNQLNTKLIEQYNKKSNIKITQLKKGSLISVHLIVSKKQKRKQVFTGTCVSYKNKGFRSSFTLHNSIYEIGVTKTFPFYSSMLTNIQILKK